MTPTDTAAAVRAAAREASGASPRRAEARVAPSLPTREFLEAVTASCVDTILTTDVRGVVTWVTARAEEAFGFDPDELVGWPMAELLVGGREEACATMRRLVSEGCVRDYVTTFPGWGGRRIPVTASIALLHDGDGTISGTVAIVRVREVLDTPPA